MSGADLVETVAHDLEEQIINGTLVAGERLPPERELCGKLGVSRSVLREAIKRLQSLGLVNSVQGSGTRVARPSHRPLIVGYQRLIRHGEAKLSDLALVRLPLETTIASLAAIHRTPEHLAQLVATQTVLGDPDRPLQEQVDADLQFHALLASATGNPIFQIVLEPIQELLIESRRTTLGQFGALLAHEHHAEILAAVKQGDPQSAAAAMERHLRANYEHLSRVDPPKAAEPPGS